MKPFNLEEYLKNPERKVMTRDGKDARIICTDARGLYPVVALIERSDGDAEDLSLFTKDGCWSIHDPASSMNLVFASKKKEGWINIYLNANRNYEVSCCVYKSKESAEEFGRECKSYITTLKIEWEE